MFMKFILLNTKIRTQLQLRELNLSCISCHYFIISFKEDLMDVHVICILTRQTHVSRLLRGKDYSEGLT